MCALDQTWSSIQLKTLLFDQTSSAIHLKDHISIKSSILRCLQISWCPVLISALGISWFWLWLRWLAILMMKYPESGGTYWKPSESNLSWKARRTVRTLRSWWTWLTQFSSFPSLALNTGTVATPWTQFTSVTFLPLLQNTVATPSIDIICRNI